MVVARAPCLNNGARGLSSHGAPNLSKHFEIFATLLNLFEFLVNIKIMYHKN